MDAVTVMVELNGVPVPVTLDRESLDAIAAQVQMYPTVASPYMSVAEAADYLRAKPQRIYDLLSSGRLTRHKDGRRVLVAREELDALLNGLIVSQKAASLWPSSPTSSRVAFARPLGLPPGLPLTPFGKRPVLSLL